MTTVHRSPTILGVRDDWAGRGQVAADFLLDACELWSPSPGPNMPPCTYQIYVSKRAIVDPNRPTGEKKAEEIS